MSLTLIKNHKITTEQFSARTQPGTFDWFLDFALENHYFANNAHGVILEQKPSLSKLLYVICQGEFEIEVGSNKITKHRASEHFVSRTPLGTSTWFKNKAFELDYTYNANGSTGKLLDAIRYGELILVKKIKPRT